MDPDTPLHTRRFMTKKGEQHPLSGGPQKGAAQIPPDTAIEVEVSYAVRRGTIRQLAQFRKINLFAFVDETGNTGSNIFDEVQPDFFTGALITKSNFDVLHRNTLCAICRRHGIESLHASALGFGPIERIAPDLLRLLKKVDARFFLSRVEKRYLAAVKLYDTFFDSGENPAANWNAYNVKVLRMILCFKVATILTEEILREFWTMLMARNEQQARAKIPEICDAILRNVHRLPDQRSREIVTEALMWSRDHPEALDIFIARRQAKNGHMPNMVAFVNLLDGLESFSKRWKRPLRKIVHDRQSQFEGSLEEWHRMFSNASEEPVNRPGETVVLRMVPGSTFEVSCSDDSAGIQVADLFLWVFRQFFTGKVLPGGSLAILSYAFRKGYQNDFSFRGVGDQIERQVQEIMERDVSPDEIEAGQRLLEKQEQLRQHLIAKYEEDNLMPYERGPTKLVAPDDE